MKKIAEHFGLRVAPLFGRVRTFSPNSTWQNPHTKNFLTKLSPQDQVIIANYGVGVEVEVERATERPINGWLVAKDGSLRNNGVEYKTVYGHRIGQLWDSLTELEHEFLVNKFQFSERCSVHAHIDVRNLTIEQVNAMFVLYLLFEHALFGFAGAKRAHNIFCVPWTESWECQARLNFLDVVGHASKYSAMNLACIREFGTVEFRQMEGNSSAERIWQWALLIACLRRYAETHTLSEIQNEFDLLKTESQYNLFMTRVFGELRHALTIDPKKIDEAISDSRLFFF